MVAYAPKSTLDDSGSPVNWLGVFRESLYAYLRADALFELADTVLMAGSAPSPVHLSLRPVRRRGWGSHYAALKKVRGGVAEPARVSSPSARRCEDRPRIYAVDVSVWPRCRGQSREGLLLPPIGTG